MRQLGGPANDIHLSNSQRSASPHGRLLDLEGAAGAALLSRPLEACAQEGAERREGARCGTPHLRRACEARVGTLARRARAPRRRALASRRSTAAVTSCHGIKAVGRPGAACKAARGSRSRLRLRYASGDALRRGGIGHGSRTKRERCQGSACLARRSGAGGSPSPAGFLRPAGLVHFFSRRAPASSAPALRRR